MLLEKLSMAHPDISNRNIRSILAGLVNKNRSNPWKAKGHINTAKDLLRQGSGEKQIITALKSLGR